MGLPYISACTSIGVGLIGGYIDHDVVPLGPESRDEAGIALTIVAGSVAHDRQGEVRRAFRWQPERATAALLYRDSFDQG